jgi:hypothetical protein
MIRTARERFASKVSKFEATDDFHFAKWLRAPQIIAPQVRAIEYSEIINDFEVEQLKPPDAFKLKFRFATIKNLPDVRQKYRLDKPKAFLIFFGLTKPRLFTMKENLLSYPSIRDFKSEMPQIPEVIDQSSVFIAKPVPLSDQSSVFIIKPVSLYDQSSIFTMETTSTFDQKINFTNVSVKDIPLFITPPQITDELANLVPEIYNIELLNVEKFDQNIVNSHEYKIEEFVLPNLEKIDVPGIDKLIKSTTTTISVPVEEMLPADVKFYSPSLEIAHSIFKVKIDIPKTIVKKVVIKQKNFEPVVVDVLNDDSLSDSAKNSIKTLLSSFRELSWTEYSKLIDGLDAYQLESADFLASNNFAILSDELGYDKFDQVSAALGFLSKKAKIRSVIVISDKTRYNEYWSSSLKSYVKEFKHKKFVPGTTKKLKGSSVVWFLDVNDLGKIEIKDFDKIDLVLLDELVNVKSASKIIDVLINKIEPSFIWFLTAVNNLKFNKKFLEEFPFAQKVEFNFFGKSLTDIQNELPVTTVKNIWLELDEMQLFEYSEALTQSRDELNKMFDSPNPLMFQSNIFTIIHKLKQILNFSSFRNISPKASLLIEQAEAIYRNKKKAFVFTQYDVNGMRKLEKALEMNNIKFVTGRNGMSAEELKQSLDTFYERREIAVFLTNLKPSRIKINLNKVPYIINFDQWWNPVTLWQNDDETGIQDIVTTPVTVYNYLIKNTFEEELEKVLSEKGFLNRYLFDNLKSETISELVSMEDWLAVFGMNNQFIKNINNERNKILTKLQVIDLNSYKALMKYFFSSLGYRDINIMDIDDEPMFYVIGTAKKGTTPVNLHGKCLLTSDLKEEDYEEIIHFKPSANEIKRKFVITNGQFAEKVTNGTMYIDGKDLANYVLTLNLKSHITKKK